MADEVIHIGENSPEQVAYKLLQHIATAEGINLLKQAATNRAWILKTYSQCISTVREPHMIAEILGNPATEL